MTQDYRINTFGLTQKQNQFVSANLPVRDCELYIADTPTDLIAVNCEAMIVNASAMEQDDADMIFGYYQEVNGCTDETILWLGEPMPPKAARKFFKCYPDFDAITDKLKYLLLSAHSRSRKSYEYSEKLVNGLKILSLIRKRPGISTQTLTELTELPLRNVQRYISALQATGEWIEYDPARYAGGSCFTAFPSCMVTFGRRMRNEALHPSRHTPDRRNRCRNCHRNNAHSHRHG